MLNFKHLHYVREVANAGSIARASERLHITPQTISGQITVLEDSLDMKLFHRQGRTLELTEAGHVAVEYANKIFQLGAELEERLQNYPTGHTSPFRVGVSDLVPKPIAYRLLEPAIQLNKQMRIVCTEGKLADLLGELAVHRMELVIADGPMPPNMNIKGFSHKLGSSTLSFFATKELKAKLGKDFPDNMQNAPLLIPSEGSAVRNNLMQWLHEHQIHPQIVGEFDDSALMKAFGLAGTGILVAPTVLEATLKKEGNLQVIGHVKELTDQYYAISVERDITNEAAKAITQHAQAWLQ
ncbi:MAG: Transcriptional regulator, LysR family [uncultured Thiotrichaceae bacterium]|uniref:Transcriptional regulator, LysR family n=1 Tax=uncultured Thiotrichaceae bacterium TaxID=298394 RepID=A0A6S6UAK2_9GAMM|nr:MAG: Transcriptional regulator, LysR family [uncultured Thiotrichaceae bacterium]